MSLDQNDPLPRTQDAASRSEVIDRRRRQVVKAIIASGPLSTVPALLRAKPFLEGAHATSGQATVLDEGPVFVPDLTRVNFAPLLLHMHSSMRMGEDSSNSVLDESGEAREIKRLFVADGSALANALGGSNPSLTINAVATRTAEKIFRRYFDGDPWVLDESPISSISRRVTRAVVSAGL